MTTSEYLVSGMSCGHCEAAILGEVNQIPGVRGVDVSAGTRRMVVTSSAPIDEEAVLGAVDEAGYEAVLVA
jgi:copper chaperone